ncbi:MULTISPECIES: D-alanyl-D-alanine carboxypeptidase family protein [Caproicibacterium]|uniref:D-alanyl-D-alanine carboxypeptidase family protein n=1 Tax=Caproicibacterium argilliputei TaxID=3030016 RepID=A0AA97H0Y4_9FIRM|nr:D-alanyl-D-alanine carboxypeptidase family protein [Caproicibacterium argilliputei]WOC31050.1 D-alanyl-D-alanine carboxypeptidase family protein [Caproicibacterium argilliputei]
MYQNRKLKSLLKSLVTLLLAGAVVIGARCPVSAAEIPAVPTVSAQSAILVNADDGSALWQKNAQQKRPMASTTKIMTALLTLEAAACEDRTVEITADMLRVEGSSMGLQVGDRISLKGLAAGMLSTSGNDAAMAAAYALAGGPVPFAKKMNQRAQELGMVHTHFVTPSGLDDEEHYSTAEDMAKLACAAMKNEDFAAITARKTVKVTFAQPAATRAYTNHNKLLAQYQGCIGVKTGFTKKAGRCLVSCAQRSGVRLIAVTLNAPDDWKDHQTMLDYGFSQLQSVPLDDSAYTANLPVVGSSVISVQVKGTAGGALVIPKGAKLVRSVELPHFLYAPLDKTQPVGQVVYRLNGREVGHTVLTAGPAVVQQASKRSFGQILLDFFQSVFQ